VTYAEDLEIPVCGGRLFFSDQGRAGCCACGWSGVPNIFDGQRSTFCPGCEVEDWHAELSAQVAADRTGARKLGRNDPCWCGSRLKYKKCHGR
jgi:hypothetical protein